MEETPIENKPIQGITLKNLIWTAGTIIAIFIAGLGYVSTIKKDIQSIANDVTELKTEKKGDTKFNELQYKVLEQKVDGQGILLKDLESKYNILLEHQINK